MILMVMADLEMSGNFKFVIWNGSFYWEYVFCFDIFFFYNPYALELPVKLLNSKIFNVLKVSSAHRACIYLIQSTAKTVKIWNIFTI